MILAICIQDIRNTPQLLLCVGDCVSYSVFRLFRIFATTEIQNCVYKWTTNWGWVDWFIGRMFLLLTILYIFCVGWCWFTFFSFFSLLLTFAIVGGSDWWEKWKKSHTPRDTFYVLMHTTIHFNTKSACD